MLSRRQGRRDLRRQCEAMLADLGLARLFDLDELIEAVSHKRRRPLRVRPLPTSAASGMPCGVWVALEHEDVLLVDQGATGVHREHIFLHELAHILCGHEGDAASRTGVAELVPDLAAQTVGVMLGRTTYDSAEEREAEALATMLGTFLVPHGKWSPEARPTVEELSRTLGF